MKVYSRITGDSFSLDRSPSDALAARIAKMRRAVWSGVKTAELWAQEEPYRLIMITLTYRQVGAWKGRQIREFSLWSKKQGCPGYVWVAELQKRGAVHYHALVLWPRATRWKMPTFDAGWAHGYTWVTDNVKHPLYIMKYLQKGLSDAATVHFPRGARLYGISQSIVRRMPFEYKCNYRDNHLPAWYREGAQDPVTRVSSYRVCGGVAFGGQKAISPYSTRDLDPVASIGQLMYNNFNT